jgi:hypothetical protein
MHAQCARLLFDEESGFETNKQTNNQVGELSISREQAEFVWDTLIPCLNKLVRRHYPLLPEQENQLIETVRAVVPFVARSLKANHQLNKFRAFDAVAFFETLHNKLWSVESARPKVDAQAAKVGPKLTTLFTQVRVQLSETTAQFDSAVLNDGQLAVHTREYAEETEVNRRFNRFCENLSTAYRGHNTVHAQLGVVLPSVVHTTAQNEPYCGVEGADDALTLGLQFQHFLRLLVDKTKTQILFKPTVLETLVQLLSDGDEGGTGVSQAEANTVNRTKVLLLQAISAVKRNMDALSNGKASNVLRQIELQDQIVSAGAGDVTFSRSLFWVGLFFGRSAVYE